jgi:hypothetical protein
VEWEALFRVRPANKGGKAADSVVVAAVALLAARDLRVRVAEVDFREEDSAAGLAVAVRVVAVRAVEEGWRGRR